MYVHMYSDSLVCATIYIYIFVHVHDASTVDGIFHNFGILLLSPRRVKIRDLIV